MAPPRKSRLHFASWYARLAAFSLEDLFSRKRPPGPPRTIYINQSLPQDYIDAKGKVKREHVYTTNQVITSKYNLITFLPRNLLEQFRRIANMFFLAIAILQFFPKFTTISPGGVILPLLVILLITALKDGYEDFKRHQSDTRVNYSKVYALTGGNWSNPNVSERKSRTFIPDFLPRRQTSSALPPDAVQSDPEFDYDTSEEQRIKGPRWKETFWEDLRVGDFVRILDNQPIPADILICATSEEEDVAFVETTNLDGETNLKSRRAVQALIGFRDAQTCANSNNSFRIQCDRPDTDMYRLNGNVVVDKQTSSVDISMTLLRGTILRNTKWVIGVVLFAGLDSKIVLNSGGTPSKRSKVERQMNPQVIANLTILALMAVVCGIADSILEQRYFPLGAPWLFRDNRSDDNPQINGLVTWAFALLTFQDVVPISLYISIEVVRTCQAAFIYLDYDMWYEKTDQATKARSWNLSDDLGQIEYIISDKTGTLTQNLMVFRKCTIGGNAYRGDIEPSHDDKEALSIVRVPTDQPADSDSTTALGDSSDDSRGQDELKTSRRKAQAPTHTALDKFKDPALQLDIDEATRNQNTASDFSKILIGFFTVLSLCHTALAAKDPVTGKVEYKAQSPDEAALVQAAAEMGFVFLGKDREILSLKIPGSTNIEKYELLDILEFTSARKRMSVVLRKQDGSLLLLTKGADNIIFERLQPGADEIKRETERHLSEFANTGLRTLTLAYKIIPADEYETWSERYREATIALDDREGRIEVVSSELEQNLCLLGATAIEDRLQDGVPETIEDLKKAGIKIWVATGDKLETAIAIGRSTNLISSDSNIIIVRRGSRSIRKQMLSALERFFSEGPVDHLPDPLSRKDLEEPIPLQRITSSVSSIVGADNGNRVGGFVLVVDNSALLEAFADDEMKGILLRLAILCEGVICCRVSPLQKALIVKLVKEGLGAITLAIGDGANDVSMIQAADVGVGISGEEGMQAVNSSDYSIAQFRFLKKLLLVHGHWSYARNGIMILNFFYKNIVPVGVLWWFQIFDGWSANYVFDYNYILLWNSLWTVAAVIGIGLFDRFLDAHVLMAVPELYHYGREGSWYNQKSFIIYMFDGIVQSAIVYFLIHFTYVSTTAREDGFDVYLYEFSTTMAISATLVVNTFAGFNSTAWTAWLFFFVFIGTLVQWLFTIIYAAVSPSFAATKLYGNNIFLFTSAYFWLSLPLTIFISLAPRFLARAWVSSYNPGDLETFQYLQKQYPNQDLSRFSRSGKAPALAALQRRTSLASRRSSHASGVGSLEARLRPSVDVRMKSRTDMSTGLVSVDRGFDFATEEHGVEMRRVQTNLSERRSNKQMLASRTAIPNKGKSNVLSLSKSFLRRKQSSQHKAPE